MIKLKSYVYVYVYVIHNSFIRTHTTVMASDSTAAPAPAPAPESISVPTDIYWPLTIAEANAWDFSYMDDSLDTSNLRDGLLAVIRAAELPATKTKEINVWQYLSNYSPPSDRGFMFSAGDDSIITLVQNQMNVGHSGASMGCTMRNIEYIAKNGLANHRQMYLNYNNNIASP